MACSVGWKSEPESLGEGKLAEPRWAPPLTTIDAVVRGVDDIGKGLDITAVVEKTDKDDAG